MVPLLRVDCVLCDFADFCDVLHVFFFCRFVQRAFSLDPVPVFPLFPLSAAFPLVCRCVFVCVLFFSHVSQNKKELSFVFLFFFFVVPFFSPTMPLPPSIGFWAGGGGEGVKIGREQKIVDG